MMKRHRHDILPNSNTSQYFRLSGKLIYFDLKGAKTELSIFGSIKHSLPPGSETCGYVIGNTNFQMPFAAYSMILTL